MISSVDLKPAGGEDQRVSGELAPPGPDNRAPRQEATRQHRRRRVATAASRQPRRTRCHGFRQRTRAAQRQTLRRCGCETVMKQRLQL